MKAPTTQPTTIVLHAGAPRYRWRVHSFRAQILRWMLGKSVQTFTPQKWDLGADGSGDSGAEIARRTDVTREFGEHFAHLFHFFDGGLIDLFLGVEAGAHRPFVEKVKERAGFDESNRFRIGQKIERKFRRNAAIEQLVFRGPGLVHRAFVDFESARIIANQRGSDESVVRVSASVSSGREPGTMRWRWS